MKPVIIVAGHGRCGSSLTMQMLQAGGIPTVGEYPSFEPEQSFSPSLRKQWLLDQSGGAVKIIDPQLAGFGVFGGVPRMVIWLDRDRKQQARSIVKFGRMVGGMPFSSSAAKSIAASLAGDRKLAWDCLGMRDCAHLALEFEHILAAPLEAAARITAFLAPHFSLDVKRAASPVISRHADCLPYLLEAQLLAERA